MSFGLSFDKVLIILVIALFLIGPERLPRYAAQLGRLARSLRDMANGARDRMRDEMGPEFDEVEWSKLDPRQYDPRRIIREALADSPPSMMEDIPDDQPEPVSATAAAVDDPAKPRYVESAYEKRLRAQGKSKPAPYDSEST